MFAGKSSADRSSLVRQAARLIVEEALEKEAADALGRGYYEHAAAGRGYRIGTRLGTVKSADGEIEFAAHQLARISFSRMESSVGREDRLVPEKLVTVLVSTKHALNL